MNAEIITIGDEILIGQTIDTNSTWIAGQLNDNGIPVYQITSVSDTREHITNALDQAKARSDIIIMTGGLGPTKDDITKATIVQYFKTNLVFNEEVYRNIQNLLMPRNIPINELNRKQAEVPENCKILMNPVGTAPGIWLEDGGRIFISLPGVPFEMKALMGQVIPLLKEKFPNKNITHKIVLVTGTFESALSEKLKDFELQLPDFIKLAYLPSPGIIKLRFTGKGKGEASMNAAIDGQIKKLRHIIPENFCGFGDDSLEGVIGNLLKSKQLTISTAESCTGGNIARMITSVPGSSAYFIGSVIAYSNAVKEKVLCVSPANLKKHGAVSKEVVEEMAAGVKKILHSDYALATSGIAGPDGSTVEKPVGTTWIALVGPGFTLSEKYSFGDNRERNIIRASITALNMLRKKIQQV